MIKRIESQKPAKKRRTEIKRRKLQLEGLEKRQLLAADLFGGADIEIEQFPQPRNIGTVQAFSVIEDEGSGVLGENDSLATAEFLPLGTGLGQEDTIDVTGNLGFEVVGNNVRTDLDFYSFDLEGGDILDIAAQGAAANFTVFYPNGQIWFGTDANTGDQGYPIGSPLQTAGTVSGAQVVPEAGRYYVALAPSTTGLNYTLGLRVYRPVIENTPIGARQVIFLDFDGGVYPTSDFSITAGLPLGIVRVQGLADSLDLLGFTNPNPGEADRIIDKVQREVEEQFRSLATGGTNGDFDTTGTPGEYGVLVLNSKDHEDPGDHPLVTRVIIGSEQGQNAPDGLFGIAQSIDVGNFRPNEKVLVLLEAHFGAAATYPISPSSSLADAAGQLLAGVTSHEVGHSFGVWHSDGNNTTVNIMDEGSQLSLDYLAGIGPDGIFGTSDDVEAGFFDDRFSVQEALFFGVGRVPAGLSQVLTTGIQGGSISGRVFDDANGDGNSQLDLGLAGVTVFADVNGNGIQDPTDASAVTGADGSFTLGVAPGTVNVIALTPSQYTPTTPTSVSVSVATNGSASGIEFGFLQVIPDITGTKFADLNGNGIFDTNEPGVPDTYIYLDLDGDDRPDIGEPGSFTDANGTYSINFPGPGTYTIREVVEPGFVQSFPATGEHIVTFDGNALTENYNFGNIPSRDFGDAPDSYLTFNASGGPSHGITTGFSLGALADRELDGQPTDTADGDDLAGVALPAGGIADDEDGVRLLSPLGPGDSATFEVTVTNTTGTPGYLQAWMDFNIDGDFNDAGEQFVTDLQLGAGTHNVTVNVPAGATVGTTYARFRYSQSQGLGVGGAADTGEVEDYRLPILSAAETANDDDFTVSRNSTANQLDVLANDFQTVDNQLTIVGLDQTGVRGSVRVSNDGQSIFYTPPNGFVGLDSFGYTVRDQFGTESNARVNVTVSFQSTVPVAVDDSFDVPQGSVNRALNVLDNDVASISGGLSIISVAAGDQGGNISIIGGGQSLRYTPLPGFAGTEQFVYTIQDAAGEISSATVTVNLQPGSQADDLIDYTIGIFDTLNNRPITNVQVGESFNVRVFVEDLRAFVLNPGVASSFLDLLYSDELVATQDTGINANFPFDITFGQLFGPNGSFQTANSQIPGLLDEVGGVQSISAGGSPQSHNGPVELFTVTMQAVAPGIATFAADPPDDVISDTTLLDSDVRLTPSQMRLGTAELTISSSNPDFPSAIDDSFPDGLDSNGNTIVANASTVAVLDVLNNDNFGPTNSLLEFGILTNPALGTVSVNTQGTAALEDDTISYVANAGVSGFDSFSYVTVSGDGIRSTADVTLTVGDAAADDLVAIDFALVDANGNSITSVNAGDRFGVQVIVEDLRGALSETYVFAGFLDMLYDSGLIRPANSTTDATFGSDDFNFDVTFGPDFNAQAAVGTASKSGIIDEFGTILQQVVAESQSVANPNLMATVFFDAVSGGTARIVGGPADALPFQDTLLFGLDDPVAVSQIRYDTLEFVINGPQSEFHNYDLPWDVNNDGLVTPIDSLLIMNELSRQQTEGEQTPGSTLYYDVSGEGNITALDAIRVMNELNRRFNGSNGEGEAVGFLPTRGGNGSTTETIDSVIETLSDSQLLGDSASDQSQASGMIDSLNSSSDQSDNDDEDQVLGLLADDIADQWS